MAEQTPPLSDNPIFQIADRAAALRAQGVDVITLAAGEPEAPTVEHIVEAAVAAARDPRTHHYGPAAGVLQLRERVAAAHPEDVTADHVQVTVGTKHALHLALGAVAGPGDEVLVLKPSWPGHVGAVESVGASVVAVPVDTNGLAALSALEAARTDRTRAVVIANPSNPSGVLHPASQLRAIAEWARGHDMWLVSDEVYGGLVFDTAPISATRLIEDRSHLIVVDGVSKVHAMTGWRVGWLIAPAEWSRPRGARCPPPSPTSQPCRSTPPWPRSGPALTAVPRRARWTGTGHAATSSSVGCSRCPAWSARPRTAACSLSPTSPRSSTAAARRPPPSSRRGFSTPRTSPSSPARCSGRRIGCASASPSAPHASRRPPTASSRRCPH